MWLLPLAIAGDTWTDPHEGMRHLHRTTSDPWEIFAVEIDLCASGVSVRATDVDERQRSVSSWAALVGADAAINGDFFSYDTYYPSGLGLGDGTHWNADNDYEGFVAFGADHAVLSPPGEVWSTLEEWMAEGVGGRPLLVEDGALTYDYDEPSHCGDLNPRTAVGLSRDRQTLLLVVVDGRSGASEGMTCEQLAELLRDLGADVALNLDGGGSSAMWIDAYGVVNEPSDGSERVVANHLGVSATGAGAPASCEMEEGEAYWDAATLDNAMTDVDGDGRADLCARGSAGWRCYPSTGVGFGEPLTTDKFADANGWADESNYTSLRTPDLDGDGRTDICARGNNQVYCALSTGSGWGETIGGPPLSDGDGWDDPRYGTTIRFADIDADGDADMCGRAPEGIRCWPWTGAGFGEEIVGPELSDALGWGEARYHGTLRMGDVSGDGRADLCARAGTGLRCWISDGAGFPTQWTGPEWSDAMGWDDVSAWSTIRLVDLDADGRGDVCGRGVDGVTCHLSTGEGFGDALAGPALSDASGWADHDNYSTIRFGDVDGDGDLDLCARANARVYCWVQEAGAFAVRIDGPELSDAAGWDDPHLYTSIRMADLDGDRRVDLCARGSAGVRCWLSEGSAFTTELAGPELSDASGWGAEPYLTTLRFQGSVAASPDDSGTHSDEAESGDDSPGAMTEVERAPTGACGCGGRAPGAELAVVGLLLLLARAGVPPRRGGYIGEASPVSASTTPVQL